MFKYRMVAAVLSALVLAIPAFAQQAPSARGTAQRELRKLALYDRLGGITGIQAVVRDFVEAAAADPRIKAFFTATAADPKRLMAFRERMTDQVCQVTGGPCAYTGRSMKEAHEGMNISNSHFDALMEDLVKVLAQRGVAEKEKREILSLLEAMRGDIVER